MGILKLESEKGCCELWQKTMDLRWYQTASNTVDLQQKSISSTGEIRWEFIEMFKTVVCQRDIHGTQAE